MGFDSHAINSMNNNRRELRQVTTGRFPTKNYELNQEKKPLRFRTPTANEKKKINKRLFIYKVKNRIIDGLLLTIGLCSVIALTYWLYEFSSSPF